MLQSTWRARAPHCNEVWIDGIGGVCTLISVLARTITVKIAILVDKGDKIVTSGWCGIFGGWRYSTIVRAFKPIRKILATMIDACQSTYPLLLGRLGDLQRGRARSLGRLAWSERRLADHRSRDGSGLSLVKDLLLGRAVILRLPAEEALHGHRP